MSTLRSDLIRIASELPKGDPTRRKLLAFMTQRGDLYTEWPMDQYDEMQRAWAAVKRKSGGLIEVLGATHGSEVQLTFRISKKALDRLLGQKTMMV